MVIRQSLSPHWRPSSFRLVPPLDALDLVAGPQGTRDTTGPSSAHSVHGPGGRWAAGSWEGPTRPLPHLVSTLSTDQVGRILGSQESRQGPRGETGGAMKTVLTSTGTKWIIVGNQLIMTN